MPLPLRQNASALPPPSAPVSGGQGVDEEIACLRTILQCLTNSLLSLKGELPGGDDQQLSLHDTREFLNLVVNLIESDTDPCRLRVLALEKDMTLVNVLLAYATCPVVSLNPSYVNQQSFSDVGIQNIQVQCIQTLTRVISACCTAAQSDPSLEETLFKVLTSMGAIDILLHFFVENSDTGGYNRNPDLKAAAAECLFVFVSKVGQAREAVIKLKASDFFFDCFCKESIPMVRNYLCAIVRLIAETYAEHLLDVSVIERCMAMLQHEQSKYVAIMLFDIMSLILGSYKSFYAARLQSNPILIDSFVQLTSAVLRRNNQFDIVTSSCGLVMTILKIESPGSGSGVSNTKQSFLERFLELNAWESIFFPDHSPHSRQGAAAIHSIDEAPEERGGVAKRWCTFLTLVEAAVTRNSIDLLFLQLTEKGIASNNILHVMLQSIAAENIPESTLSLLLLLLKDPRWRDLLQAIPQTDPEKENLKSTLFEKLSQIDATLYEEMFIIDINGTYMNDPTDTIDFSDLTQVFAAAQFRVKSQYSIEGFNAASPEQTYYFGSNNLSRKDKKVKLTTALFSSVVTETFLNPVAGVQGSDVDTYAKEARMLQSPPEVSGQRDLQVEDAMMEHCYNQPPHTGPFEPESVPQVPVPHTSMASVGTTASATGGATIGNLPVAPFPGHEHLFDKGGSLLSNIQQKSIPNRSPSSRAASQSQHGRATSPSGWTPGQPTSFSHLSHNDILGSVSRGPFVSSANMTNVQKYAQFMGVAGRDSSPPASAPSSRRRSKPQPKKVQRWR